MKKLILLAFLMPLILVSCHKDRILLPEARFSTNTVTPEVGQDIEFINESHNGISYEWDFGDGFISNERDPIHFFSANGVYDVQLTVFGEDGTSDVATLTMTVYIPTLLEIEVREYYDDYPVADASVILYPSKTAWDDQQNSVAEGYTDNDGFVVFAGLDNYAYYVDVWEQNHDNYTLAEENYQEFIMTPDVMPHKITRFIAWVDYVEHTKGVLKGTRTAKIVKVERKAPLRSQPGVSVSTDGWEKLYERSIRVKK